MFESSLVFLHGVRNSCDLRISSLLVGACSFILRIGCPKFHVEEYAGRRGRVGCGKHGCFAEYIVPFETRK